MIVIPAIDIKNGKSVRLKQGKFDAATVHSDNPVETAKLWQQKGAKRIHVVDLDGALKGERVNKNLISEICRTVNIPVEIGGGIRNLDSIKELFDLGASFAILGTVAVEKPEIVKEAVEKFGADKIIVAIDAKNGYVATKGWVDVTSVKVEDLALKLKSFGLKEVLYTDISRDGMLTGPDFDGLKTLAKTGLKIIASGGVKSNEDIIKLKELESGGVYAAIVGAALYTDNFDLSKAIRTASETGKR
ncbi:1-(5-phosphoribosyl)-5-[(5-phosphoribosylamino)methylideneamino]imidazole-4-carboxamide isomerase [Endomicrobium proavitum]|uniref:1-(5-phosphoribosyl)-5-[(5-phosphoribosylamino)methylideneamino] imidazole-4-carboxamide isomerase n=1 Tax=Endomicrobium proavitum TaxID=1408281 RepID=A0A0G3WGJ2_9BACT|nr:1-(5-phosphoribosyl)-5-[(5-phosphoribosylamino)methylideneamino]imidazole-4-carboxamide isomerase [Endomicrobium proavitum]AKL97801.1 1-(5-phosphoribosyl)-5-[(5-phosphoribosylamino)methylideneamino] imidazole-4-carboxamide isomerase [Endomicrobium proavitum]